MGGIKKGTKASTCESLTIDRQVRECAKILREEYTHVIYQSKLKKSQIPGGRGACAPDGGVWFRNGKPIVAFEAKKQGNAGNAIERWFKNHFILRKINPGISYVTFAVGEGAKKDGVIPFILSVAHDGEDGQFDKFTPGKNSCYLSQSGFDSGTILSIMREVLKNER